MNQSGWVYAYYSRGYETNHDFLATYDKAFFNDKFNLTAIAGVNVNERYSTGLTGETDQLTFETEFWDLSNGATKTTLSESQSLRRQAHRLEDRHQARKRLLRRGMIRYPLI